MTLPSRQAAACALALVAFTGPAWANLSAAFDTSAEGWTADDPTNHDWGFLAWQSAGGNPGGYVKAVENSPTGGTGYFFAPPSWNGNWTPYTGGTLSFDIAIIQGSAYYVDDDVRIYSGSSYLAWRSGQTQAWSGWKQFGLTLDPATFGNPANFASILSNVTGLRIRGEYITGIEAEGLDNVRLSALAVPEPASAALMLAGLGLTALAAVRRRRP